MGNSLSTKSDKAAAAFVAMVLASALKTPGLWDLKRQFGFYNSFHVNKVNIAIHFACIWPILWTSFAVLHKTTPFFGKKASKDGESSQGVNWATVAAGVYAAYYALMDNSIGRVGALMVLASYKTSGTWVHSGPNNVRKALAINALAWVGQIYGHLAHEGRAPALMSNLSQGVLMGPLFVLFEAAHSLGFKKEFFAEIRDIVGVNLLELKLGKGPATA